MASSLTTIQALLTLNVIDFVKNLKTAGSNFDKVTGAMVSVGGLLTKTVTEPIIGIGKKIVEVGKEFESTMSQVQALSGATADELKYLEDVARQLGAETAYSASQAAEGFTYMALAGWDVEEMATALPSVLYLAGAGMSDLGTISDIVTDNITAFGLTADDAAEFCDVLAVAMSNSNTNVEQLGEAFKYVAPLAGTFGFTVQDTATVLGIMADNGIKGSQAGTALRGSLTRLASPTDEAAKLMEELGIDITNADGSMKDLDDIIGILRGAFEGLSEEQQVQAASTLFGQQALAGMLAVINTSEEDYNSLADAIMNADGAAEEMYHTTQDNLQGSLAVLSSALQELALQIYEIIIPYLMQFVEWLTSVVQWFQNLDDGTKETIVKIAALAAAIGPVIIIIGSLATGIKGIIKNITSFASTIVKLGKTIGTFITAHPVIAIIAAVIAAIIFLYNNVEWFRDAVDAVLNFIKDLVVNVFNTVVKFFTETVPNAIETMVQFFKDLPQNIADAISNAITAVAEWGQNVYNTFVEWVSNTIDAVVDFFTGLPGKIGYAIGYAIGTIIQWGIDVFNTFTEWVSNTIDAVVDFFTDLPEKIGYAIGFAIGKIIEWGILVFNTFTEWVVNTIDAVVTFFTELPGKIYDAIVNTIALVTEWAINLYNTFIEWITKTIDDVTTWFSELPGRIWNAIIDTIQRVGEWGQQTWNKFSEWVNKTITDIGQWFSELPGKIYNAIVGAIDRIAQWGRDVYNTAKTWVTDTVNGIVQWFKDLPRQMLSIGSDIVTGIWNGISGAAGWLYDQVAGFAKGIINGIKGALGIKSPSRVARDEVGEEVPAGVAVGVEDNADVVDSAIDDLRDNIVMGLDLESTNMGDSLVSGLAESFAAMQESISGVQSLYTGNDSSDLTAVSEDPTIEAENEETSANAFHIENFYLEVRDDDDIETLSQALFNHNAQTLRALGGNTKNG